MLRCKLRPLKRVSRVVGGHTGVEGAASGWNKGLGIVVQSGEKARVGSAVFMFAAFGSLGIDPLVTRPLVKYESFKRVSEVYRGLGTSQMRS